MLLFDMIFCKCSESILFCICILKLSTILVLVVLILVCLLFCRDTSFRHSMLHLQFHHQCQHNASTNDLKFLLTFLQSLFLQLTYGSLGHILTLVLTPSFDEIIQLPHLYITKMSKTCLFCQWTGNERNQTMASPLSSEGATEVSRWFQFCCVAAGFTPDEG